MSYRKDCARVMHSLNRALAGPAFARHLGRAHVQRRFCNSAAERTWTNWLGKESVCALRKCSSHRHTRFAHRADHLPIFTCNALALFRLRREKTSIVSPGFGCRRSSEESIFLWILSICRARWRVNGQYTKCMSATGNVARLRSANFALIGAFRTEACPALHQKAAHILLAVCWKSAGCFLASPELCLVSSYSLGFPIQVYACHGSCFRTQQALVCCLA